ncbi:hypothetical protein BLA39750_04967 [Burkholderia lata]|uniref:Uncharacterized protein n=1 Tax=Burkholderia lata (strain ATCC 17760 / DSM 23089 / LMG 22485 / NCIMB 9086 / R18194 / 383) TaxID=482957 RepID=A0A6P2ZKB2_BURL3|nr:hypothetical protein BLA39750_04967 [Burkholderia lata]
MLPVAYTSASFGFEKLSVGSGTSAVCSGFTRCGVIRKISSVRSCWNDVLRNSAPSTGTSPTPGIAFSAPVTLSLISPPIANDSPSLICTVVDARRVVISGRIDVPPMLVALSVTPVCDSSDTSGATFRLIRPFASTVGVNFSATPNSSSCSVIVDVPLPLLCGIGMKILPPARNVASWPLIVTRFGSARILTRLSVFCASAARLNGLLFDLLNATPLATPASRLLTSAPLHEPNPPWMLSALPIWFISVFDTSATFTSSITCCGDVTASMFSTPPPLCLPPAAGSPAPALSPYACAICTACCAACELDTVPDSTIVPAAVVTRISRSFGISCASDACRPPASAPTATSITRHAPLRPCTIMLVVPTDSPRMYSVCGDTIVACATAGLPIVRLRTGSGIGTSSDLPSGTLTLVDSRTAPTQFGPRSGPADAAGAAAATGPMLIVICIGPLPTAAGALAPPFVSTADSAPSWASAP